MLMNDCCIDGENLKEKKKKHMNCYSGKYVKLVWVFHRAV